MACQCAKAFRRQGARRGDRPVAEGGVNIKGSRTGMLMNKHGMAAGSAVQSDRVFGAIFDLVNPAWSLESMAGPTPPDDKTGNWPAQNEALKRRGSLMIRWPAGDGLQSP